MPSPSPATVACCSPRKTFSAVAMEERNLKPFYGIRERHLRTCFHFGLSLLIRQTPRCRGFVRSKSFQGDASFSVCFSASLHLHLLSVELINVATLPWLPSSFDCLVHTVLFQHPSLNSACYLFVYWGRSMPFQNSSLGLLGLLPATSVFRRSQMF